MNNTKPFFQLLFINRSSYILSFQRSEAILIGAEEARKYGVEIPMPEEFEWGKFR